jgi:hypothetical protein
MADKDRDEGEKVNDDAPADEAPKKEAAHDEDEHEAGESKAPDDEDEPEEKPAPKAAAKSSATAKASSKPGTKPARRRAPPPPKGGSLAKSLVLFVVILGGLAVVFKLLGGGVEEGGAGPVPAPKWNNGQVVDVEITLVPSDAKDLACASAQNVEGKHCQFESQGKAFGTQPDDKHMLKPYTTTDRIQFVAAGLWSDPGMAPSKLPATRFSVKCKYKVEGKVTKPAVRWSESGQWFQNPNDWYAGSVSGCTLVSGG